MNPTLIECLLAGLNIATTIILAYVAYSVRHHEKQNRENINIAVLTNRIDNLEKTMQSLDSKLDSILEKL